MSLLVGRSFETSTVPNLKFPSYESACERSYYIQTKLYFHFWNHTSKINHITIIVYVILMTLLFHIEDAN